MLHCAMSAFDPKRTCRPHRREWLRCRVSLVALGSMWPDRHISRKSWDITHTPMCPKRTSRYSNSLSAGGLFMHRSSIAVIAVVCTGVVGLTTPSANAAPDCRSIVAPMERLACYDRATNTAAPSHKPSAIKPVLDAAYNAAPATLPLKAKPPVKSGPRFWLEVDGGIYGFSKNLPVLAATAPPATTAPTPVPTAPGFIGLVTTSTVTNPLINGDPALSGGGGKFRMGYWLDPERTMAVDGSVFFVQGNSKFDLSPTTVTTRNSINTTPDTFVGLHDDATTTTLTNGAIREQLYGADLNFRIKTSRFAELPNFDVMAGLRYVALDEKFAASVGSVFSSTFAPALGIPPPVDFSNSSSGSASFRFAITSSGRRLVSTPNSIGDASGSRMKAR